MKTWQEQLWDMERRLPGLLERCDRLKSTQSARPQKSIAALIKDAMDESRASTPDPFKRLRGMSRECVQRNIVVMARRNILERRRVEAWAAVEKAKKSERYEDWMTASALFDALPAQGQHALSTQSARSPDEQTTVITFKGGKSEARSMTLREAAAHRNELLRNTK